LTLTEDQLRYEPALKNLLRERGFFVPRGIVVSDVSLLESQAADLTAPLVLKVFGPGITHKTELGAVMLVFTETELPQGVTQRYQPNVGTTRLPNIKTDKLPAAIDTVVRIFEEACRCIDGHSQPLVSLGISPTLPGLEEHWKQLQECKKLYDEKA
jgi:hypothetical protein